MDFKDLKETTMDPKTRTLKKVTLDEVEKMVQTINICMGTDANLRREFIEENAYKISVDI